MITITTDAVTQAILKEREECAQYAELLAEGWKNHGKLNPVNTEEARASICALVLLAAALRARR